MVRVELSFSSEKTKKVESAFRVSTTDGVWSSFKVIKQTIAIREPVDAKKLPCWRYLLGSYSIVFVTNIQILLAQIYPVTLEPIFFDKDVLFNGNRDFRQHPRHWKSEYVGRWNRVKRTQNPRQNPRVQPNSAPTQRTQIGNETRYLMIGFTGKPNHCLKMSNVLEFARVWDNA